MTTFSQETKDIKDPRQGFSRRNNICLAVLFFTNLINYMDRYTVSAVLESISKDVCQPEEHCTTTQEGLIQTAFVVVYLVVAPIFGYLGDRHSRKYIMAAGVFVWGCFSLAASFMTTYWPFLSLRALIAIGESAFTTIAPTVLGDLFTEDTRGLVLGIFYLAIPFGSGLGYVIGKAPEDWHNGLRITPGLNFLAVILIIMFVIDPPRGVHEKEERESSFMGDVYYLFGIKSFLLNVAGFTCVTHFTGALSWFGPTYVIHGLRSCQFQVGVIENTTLTTTLSTATTTAISTTADLIFRNSDRCETRIDPDSVSFYFGVILMMSGVVGVISGMLLSRWLRPKYPRIDPLICGVSLVISVPLVTYGVITAKDDLIVAFVFIFFGTTFLNMNWSISVDMSLYVVLPNRRSTAEAIHLMATHALGEAGAPYIIGTVSDAIIGDICPDLSCQDVELAKYLGLQRAMYLAFSLLFLGGIMYILATIWIKPEKEKVDRYLEAELARYSENVALSSQRKIE